MAHQPNQPMSITRVFAASLLLLGVMYFIFEVLVGEAWAHTAVSGWSYPYACCSDKDCREVHDAAISERPGEGYVIEATGELVTYDDRRIRNSPDGLFHWCSVAGLEDSRTICLFVPPKAF